MKCTGMFSGYRLQALGRYGEEQLYQRNPHTRPEQGRQPTHFTPSSRRQPGRLAPRIRSLAFSPIMIEAALVLPLMTEGMIDASATRSPAIP